MSLSLPRMKRLAKRPVVPSIAFETTSECNLRCSYCYNVWKGPNGNEKFRGSFSSAIKTLRMLVQQAKIHSIAFTGGEPFLLDRLPELILWCRMHRMGVTVATNGVTASKKQYLDSVTAGAQSFQIPFLSLSDKIHDTLIGTPGSRRRVCESLEFLCHLKARIIPAIELTKINAHSLTETLEYLADRGLCRIMLNRFNEGGTGIEHRWNLSLSAPELSSCFRTANEEAKGCRLRITSNVALPRCVLDPNDFPKIRFTSCGKDVTDFPVTVTSDGNVRLCNHSPVVLGNLLKTRIETILKTSHAREFLGTVPAECLGCEKWYECGGGCRAASEQLGLGFMHADPLCRQDVTQKRLMPTAMERR